MNVIINPEYEKLLQEYLKFKEQLAVVLEERDNLIHYKAVSIKTDYILKIGKLEYDLFQLECTIERVKRKIEMIQACINLQHPVNEQQIDEKLDKEYYEYTTKLEKMASEIDVANRINKCKNLTDKEYKEIKKLYRLLAKKLHPDVNSNQTEDQKKLWNRVVDAYKAGNLEMLRILAELTLIEPATENEIRDIAELVQLKEKINSLKLKCRDVFIDIENIKQAFPFNTTELLNNPELLEKRQAELNARIKENRHTLELYQAHLHIMTTSSSKIIH